VNSANLGSVLQVQDGLMTAHVEAHLLTPCCHQMDIKVTRKSGRKHGRKHGRKTQQICERTCAIIATGKSPGDLSIGCTIKDIHSLSFRYLLTHDEMIIH